MAAVCALPAAALPLPCVSGSLANYSPTTAGSTTSCQYQDLIFTFQYQGFIYQKDPSQPDPAGGIENFVTITFQSLSPGIEGIVLSPTLHSNPANDYLWKAVDGGGSDVNFTYSVAPVAGQAILGARVEAGVTIVAFDPPDTGAAVFGAETLSSPGGTALNPAPIVFSLFLEGTGSSTEIQMFSRPSSSIGLNKDIALVSLSAGDQAYLDYVGQYFYVMTPEPGAVALTGGGLAWLLLRKRRNAGRILGILGMAIAASASANASPLCTQVGTKLDQFINAGSCEISGTLFTFSGASYSYPTPVLTAGTGKAVAASQVDVNVVTGANPGFQFVGQWVDSGAQNSTLNISFTATAPAGQAISSAIFTATAQNLNAGTSTGTSTVTNGQTPLGYTFPAGGIPITVLPNLSTVTLTATVNLRGNGNTTATSKLRDVAHLSNLVMTVGESAYVPEPSTYAFTGGSLLFLCGFAGFAKRIHPSSTAPAAR